MQEAKMKGFPAFFTAAVVLIGSSTIAAAEDRSLEQRGMDALDNFLGTDDRPSEYRSPYGDVSPDEEYRSSYGDVSPDEVVRDLERMNFHDISEPVRRGGVYLVYAIDPEGQDVELTVDAESGRIVDRRYRG
jgi:hypothetical protein